MMGCASAADHQKLFGPHESIADHKKRKATVIRGTFGKRDESLASLLAADDDFEDILIECLSGAHSEPFPSSGHWELFCHMALSVLFLRSIVDQEHGRGLYGKILDASKFRPVLQDTDCPSPDTEGKDAEAKAKELVRQWLTEGHDHRHFPDIDGLIPKHPGLVFRIRGGWQGWNNFLGCEPGDDTYGENLHTDMIEDRAFQHYIEAAKKVLLHIKQGQKARGWSELAMFTFLKGHAGEWAWDPRHDTPQSPTVLDAEDSVHEVLQDIASLDDEMKADGLEPSTETMKNEARRIVIALAELHAEPTAYGTQDGDIAIQFGSGKSAVVIELSRVGGAACFSHVKGKNRWARYDDSEDLPDEFVLSQLHEL